eukprot:TRINITY_DN4311_c2_g1_i2.p1 TRINITY_DN4311_c2_g1~~TRINITY_DN4311_c2_g1_i2.p1  ORF type:complete len:529 (+),score=120.28 TRINITY_DN4311_c2_g1_i2:45-1631(+)
MAEIKEAADLPPVSPSEGYSEVAYGAMGDHVPPPPPPPPAEYAAPLAEYAAQPAEYIAPPETQGYGEAGQPLQVMGGYGDVVSPTPAAPPLEAVMGAAARNRDMLMSEAPHVAAPVASGSYQVTVTPTVDDMPPRGTKVTVTQLISNYSLNGKSGTVVGYRSDGAVLVDVDGVLSAPLHPSNLIWGDDANIPIPKPDFMQPKMNITERNGVCLIRVKPPRRRRDTTTCCPSASWGDMTFFKHIGWVWTSMFACIVSFPLSVILLFFSPLFFSQSAIGWRWLAHRHLDILLSGHPPSRGAIVTHPTAVMEHGSRVSYFMSGHTWRCFVYVTLLALPFSFVTLFFTMMCVPFGVLMCCRPLFCFGANVVYGALWLERSVCLGMVGHVMCEYSLAEMGDAELQQGEATVGGVVDEVTPVLTSDGQSNGMQNSWLSQRQRSQEELMSVEKFNNSYLRLFGTIPRLQDITIEPPREPGRGPRHFITVADAINDSQRLKLVKAYKQAFSTMYVHIVDLEEQQRQEGTDYSALYS